MNRRYTVGILLPLSGCITPQSARIVPDPSNLKFENAMVSLMKGLRQAQDAAYVSDGERLGLNPCTAKVTFNVSAGGKDNRELVVNADLKGGVKGASAELSGKDSASSEATANRGSSIEVLLTSPACNPADTLGTKFPDKVALMASGAAQTRQSASDNKSRTLYNYKIPPGWLDNILHLKPWPRH